MKESRSSESNFSSSGGTNRKASSDAICTAGVRNTRRKEQNRNFQRERRNRKEDHQKYFENQVDFWKQKHTAVLESHTTQSERIAQLTALIDDLNAQTISLQAGVCCYLASVGT